MRFVPVPHEALDACEQRDWGAVVDLYKRAHSLRWKPFRVTERSLATRWGCSGRRVWVIIEALELQGLLVLVKGSRRKQSNITLVEPTMHKGQRRGQQKSQGFSSSSSESEAQDEAQDEETSGETLDQDLRPTPPSPPSGDVLKLVKVMVAQLEANGDEGWDPDNHAMVVRASDWCKAERYPSGVRRVEQAMRIALAQYRGEA